MPEPTSKTQDGVPSTFTWGPFGHWGSHVPDHGQPRCKQHLCCCHILTQPCFGGRAGSLLSHSHGLLNKEEQKWPQATCLMGQEHGIAGSRESSQDPGRPKKKPSILLIPSLNPVQEKSCKRLLPPASSGATCWHRQRGITGCSGQGTGEEILLALLCGYSTCANHGLHTPEQCDPKASTGYTPQPRWQQRAALRRLKEE